MWPERQLLLHPALAQHSAHMQVLFIHAEFPFGTGIILKTLSLASVFIWAGLVSRRGTTFIILCFIAVVYTPKAH